MKTRTFTIKFNLDNDAFFEEEIFRPEAEMKRILENIINKIDGFTLNDQFIVRDINGNKIGNAFIQTD